jgi:HPt (histidine-containing phosphotransfer) domain-containing protein
MAHNLKGATGTLGAMAAHTLAAELENALRNETALAIRTAQLENLSAEIQRVTEAINLC